MLDFSKASEWKIIETDFDPTALGKVEANFCLGNGYLGLRSATEEKACLIDLDNGNPHSSDAGIHAASYRQAGQSIMGALPPYFQ